MAPTHWLPAPALVLALSSLLGTPAVGSPPAPSARCSSGFRVPLETDAVLKYVSAKEGWGRKDDLVDEQTRNSPWNGWEPGYPNKVTVQLKLFPRAKMDELLIAQDPSAPTGGKITLKLVGPQGRIVRRITMSGTGGWKSVKLGLSFNVKKILVTRKTAESNIMELIACASATNVNPTPEPPVTQPPDTLVESLGVRNPPETSACAWRAVDEYYSQYAQPGICSKTLHNKYWVLGPDGLAYPTWHPPKHQSGCHFQHEHGPVSPQSSNIYQFSQGLPFGFVNQQQGSCGDDTRHEDHVGHKVVVKNSWEAAIGNSVDGTPIGRTGIICNWLSKLHQGTWSEDALGNNVHEYFLNLKCTDSSAVRIKELATFGDPSIFHNHDDNEKPTDGGVEAKPYVTIGSRWFQDGKRSIPSAQKTRARPDDNNIELWKPDGVIEIPGGGSIQYSAYYMIRDPMRVANLAWKSEGLPNALTRTLDLCFDQSNALSSLLCQKVTPALASVTASDRWMDTRSPFKGLMRAVHPKTVDIANANGAANAGAGLYTDFCTGPIARRGYLPVDSGCEEGDIMQRVSVGNNNWFGQGISGSFVNAVNEVGAGWTKEWVFNLRGNPDYSEVHAPN